MCLKTKSVWSLFNVEIWYRIKNFFFLRDFTLNGNVYLKKKMNYSRNMYCIYCMHSNFARILKKFIIKPEALKNARIPMLILRGRLDTWCSRLGKYFFLWIPIRSTSTWLWQNRKKIINIPRCHQVIDYTLIGVV